ncbi:MAG: fadD3, partial [Tardiphaga sp.]|nr:fadD3 [Tardiphaga sp.]
MPTRADAAPWPDQASGVDTFPKFLIRQAHFAPAAASMREKEFGIWQTYTWSDVARRIERIALGINDLGFCRGDTLAVLGRNRPQLYWAFHATQALGGIPVPLFSEGTPTELAGILNHCEARIAIVEDQEQVDKLLSIIADLRHIEWIIYLDPRGLRSYRHEKLSSFHKLIEVGEASMASRPGYFREEIAKGCGSDVSIICYTSGTTGVPKGVMLSFDNLISTAKSMAELEGLSPADQILAYLPMAWIGDHFFSYAQSNIVGFPVNCPESEATILSDLREIAPTYFFAPPRVFEGMLTDIAIRMQNAGRPKRAVYDGFMAVAKRCGVKILEGKEVSLLDRTLYAIGRLIIYRPMLNALGLSRLRIAFTAGEALGPEIFDFFRALGINLKQLYGQTESSVYVCVHRNGEVRSDTVGPPAPGVEIRFSEQGELHYRSPGVFVSYLKSEQDALEIKDGDGWVKSGDAAVLTDDGQVRIIDRVKVVGRMDDGDLFPPKYIENKLMF